MINLRSAGISRQSIPTSRHLQNLATIRLSVSQPCLKAESLIPDTSRHQNGLCVKILTFKMGLSYERFFTWGVPELAEKSLVKRAVVALQPFPGAELSQLWVLGLVGHGHTHGYGYGHGYSKLWTHRDKSLHITHLSSPFVLSAGSYLSTDPPQLPELGLDFAIHGLDTQTLDTTIRSLHTVKQVAFWGLFVCLFF